MQLRFPHLPSTTELGDAIEARIPPERWFNDVHGSAAYKQHVTRYFAEQIRAELAESGSV